VEPVGPASIDEAAPVPPTAGRASRFAALIRRLRRRARIEPSPIEEPSPATAEPEPEPAAAEAEPEPIAAEPDPEPAPEPPPAASTPEPAGEDLETVLTAALDSLGSAHHRPFSRG
jgi:hypothetical protein